MTDMLTHIEQARAAIVDKTTLVPRIGLILGSGLGALADDMTDATVIPYTDIPHFPVSTVVGHRGELAIGMLADQPVIVLRGRFHFYEGYTMQQVTFPVRVFHSLGCDTLFVTNAAGGLHADWNVGDLMLITDQIFLPGMVGHHPLRGPNNDKLGPRFPPMVDAFDPELQKLAQTKATEVGVTLRQGVYTMLTGPTFESSAELRMLRAWGSDAVGMSTAPEVAVARHAGMRVLGISLITNLALPDGPPANHEEVLEAGELAKPKFSELVKRIVAQM